VIGQGEELLDATLTIHKHTSGRHCAPLLFAAAGITEFRQDCESESEYELELE
jgi:hypothetical protein